MAETSLIIGNGNWAVKSNSLLGYNIFGSQYSAIPIDTTRATTATRVNQLGLIEIVPTGITRVDYTNGVGSLLLEPQRTNLLLNSVWDSVGTTPTSWPVIGGGVSSVVASVKNPNVTAYNFVSTSVNRRYFFQIQAFTINTITSLSVYVEQALVPTQAQHILSVVNATGTSTFFKNNVSISATEIIQAGNTYTLVFSATATTPGSEVRVGMYNTGIIGNVTLSMPQLELGSYSTSFIPTTTSTVTRNQDLASVSGVSSLIGQTEGVLFVQSAALSDDLTNRIVSLSDGTTNNRIYISYNPTTNLIAAIIVVANTIVVTLTYTITDTTQFAKIALRYSNTLGASLWVNGVNRASSIVTTLPTSISRFGFDGGAGSTTYFSKVKSTQLYKTYLIDAEMVSLTTL